jgi:hypothetical protein
VNVEEMKANFFAASILMPRRFLEADPLMAELDVEDAATPVKVSAARYNVSPCDDRSSGQSGGASPRIAQVPPPW